jgi:hypothetical protein
MFSFKTKKKFKKPNIVIFTLAALLSYLNYSGVSENIITQILETTFSINPTPNAIKISLFIGISCLFFGTAMSQYKNKKPAIFANNTGVLLLSSALGCIGGWLIAAIPKAESYSLVIASLFLYILLITMFWVIPNVYHTFVMKYIQGNSKGKSLVAFSSMAITVLAIMDLSKQVII